VIELLKQNKLSVKDVADFDHDLLKSIGIEVAKERLEMLKWCKAHPVVAEVSDEKK